MDDKIKHHALKTWVSGGIAPHILNLATRYGEWVASCSGHFTPEEGALGI